MGAIYRHFHLAAFMRTTMRTLVEGQSIADTYMFGNVALKTPVYDWGYTRQFGDEINWGNAIVMVPSILNDLYGDTSLMAAYYDRMVDFIDYIQREKVESNIVYAALGDWIEDDNADTSGFITGMWGYYLAIQAMARMANVTGHMEDAEMYSALAPQIRDAFNAEFFDDRSGQYRNNGSTGVSNATQAAQALALDSGLVEEGNRQSVLQALVNLSYAYGPANESGPHLSGGLIGLSPIVRALSAGGYDDVLWEALNQNEQPSYGFFIAPTAANSNGLTSAEATYLTMKGEAASKWTLGDDGAFALEVTVPSNMRAEARVPGQNVQASGRAERVGEEERYVHTVCHLESIGLGAPSPSWKDKTLAQYLVFSRSSLALPCLCIQPDLECSTFT